MIEHTPNPMSATNSALAIQSNQRARLDDESATISTGSIDALADQRLSTDFEMRNSEFEFANPMITEAVSWSTLTSVLSVKTMMHASMGHGGGMANSGGPSSPPRPGGVGPHAGASKPGGGASGGAGQTGLWLLLRRACRILHATLRRRRGVQVLALLLGLASTAASFALPHVITVAIRFAFNDAEGQVALPTFVEWLATYTLFATVARGLFGMALATVGHTMQSRFDALLALPHRGHSGGGGSGGGGKGGFDPRDARRLRALVTHELPEAACCAASTMGALAVIAAQRIELGAVAGGMGALVALIGLAEDSLVREHVRTIAAAADATTVAGAASPGAVPLSHTFALVMVQVLYRALVAFAPVAMLYWGVTGVGSGALPAHVLLSCTVYFVYAVYSLERGHAHVKSVLIHGCLPAMRLVAFDRATGAFGDAAIAKVMLSEGGWSNENDGSGSGRDRGQRNPLTPPVPASPAAASSAPRKCTGGACAHRCFLFLGFALLITTAIFGAWWASYRGMLSCQSVTVVCALGSSPALAGAAATERYGGVPLVQLHVPQVFHSDVGCTFADGAEGVLHDCAVALLHGDGPHASAATNASDPLASAAPRTVAQLLTGAEGSQTSVSVHATLRSWRGAERAFTTHYSGQQLNLLVAEANAEAADGEASARNQQDDAAAQADLELQDDKWPGCSSPASAEPSSAGRNSPQESVTGVCDRAPDAHRGNDDTSSSSQGAAAAAPVAAEPSRARRLNSSVSSSPQRRRRRRRRSPTQHIAAVAVLDRPRAQTPLLLSVRVADVRYADSGDTVSAQLALRDGTRTPAVVLGSQFGRGHASAVELGAELMDASQVEALVLTTSGKNGVLFSTLQLGRRCTSCCSTCIKDADVLLNFPMQAMLRCTGSKRRGTYNCAQSIEGLAPLPPVPTMTTPPRRPNGASAAAPPLLSSTSAGAFSLGMSALAAASAGTGAAWQGGGLHLSFNGFELWMDCAAGGAARFQYVAAADAGNYNRHGTFRRAPASAFTAAGASAAYATTCQQRTGQTYARWCVSPLRDGKPWHMGSLTASQRRDQCDGDGGQIAYDRGHLVPANHLDHDREAIKESNYMPNILPQAAALNRGAWLATEELVECWRDHEPLRVLGGAVFPAVSPQNASGVGPAAAARDGAGYDMRQRSDWFLASHGVRTPLYFWKVVQATTLFPVDHHRIAFWFPNSHISVGKGDLAKYVVSIDTLVSNLAEHGLTETIDEVVDPAQRAHKPSSPWALPPGCDRG